MLSGNNGIINKAGRAKESSEIAEERELVEISSVQAMGKNKYGDLTKENLKEKLDQNAGEGKTKVYNEDDSFVVLFNESNRLYTVDVDGNVEYGDSSILGNDPTPGEITKDENGRIIAGNEADPYMIMSIEDLVSLSQNTKNGTDYNNRYIKLGRNLDFNSVLSYCNYETKEYNEFLGIEDDIGLMEALTSELYSGFIPIVSFRGTFDGNNQYIKNLYINNSEYAGFFKSLVGTVQNLKLTGEIKCNGNYAGAIASNGGSNVFFVSNCISYVNIEATGNQIGGIMGSSSTNIRNCVNYGTIKGNNTIGGICGQYGSISDCVNYGEVTGIGDRIGGIMGQPNKYLKNCKNYGNITGATNVGGISGSTGGCVNCFNFGNIKATLKFAGGISGVATNTNTIINCYNKGSIESTTYVGGILGVLSYTSGTTSRVINCYNIGDVKGNKYVGGIIGTKDGYGTSYIDNSFWKEVNGLNGYFNTGGNGGVLEVTNTQAYSQEFIKTQEFIDILNSFANTYNAGGYETNPNKTYSESEDLLRWKPGEDGYPVFE